MQTHHLYKKIIMLSLVSLMTFNSVPAHGMHAYMPNKESLKMLGIGLGGFIAGWGVHLYLQSRYCPCGGNMIQYKSSSVELLHLLHGPDPITLLKDKFGKPMLAADVSHADALEALKNACNTVKVMRRDNANIFTPFQQQLFKLDASMEKF